MTFLPRNKLPCLMCCFFGVPLFSTNQANMNIYIAGVLLPAKFLGVHLCLIFSRTWQTTKSCMSLLGWLVSLTDSNASFSWMHYPWQTFAGSRGHPDPLCKQPFLWISRCGRGSIADSFGRSDSPHFHTSWATCLKLPKRDFTSCWSRSPSSAL